VNHKNVVKRKAAPQISRRNVRLLPESLTETFTDHPDRTRIRSVTLLPDVATSVFLSANLHPLIFLIVLCVFELAKISRIQPNEIAVLRHTSGAR